MDVKLKTISEAMMATGA